MARLIRALRIAKIRTRHNVTLYQQHVAWYVSFLIFSVMPYANKNCKNRCNICDLKKKDQSLELKAPNTCRWKWLIAVCDRRSNSTLPTDTVSTENSIEGNFMIRFDVPTQRTKNFSQDKQVFPCVTDTRLLWRLYNVESDGRIIMNY